jgi:hypothetical protein
MSASDRRALIDHGAPSLSVRRQCVLLGVARSGVYRAPRSANDNDLVLCQPCSEVFRANLLPHGVVAGGGSGEAVSGDVDGGGA